MVTEQLKKKVHGEIKEHFVDDCEEINQATVLAEKCDKFEAVRKETKKWEPRSFTRNSFNK